MQKAKKNIFFTLLSNFIILCYFPLISNAHPTHDVQSWNNLTVTSSFNDNLKFWLETQLRFGHNISNLSQSVARTAVGYDVNNQHSVWFGYAWIDTKKPFSDININEHRLWQQHLYIGSFDFGKISSRTRLEERFIKHNAETAWRFRQFARLQQVITNDKKYFIALSNEIFLNINNTAKHGNNSGFEQNRLFAGVGFYPKKVILIEVGYQNQFIKNISKENFIGHTILMNIVGNL
jgi:hypothetical protein